MRPDGIDLNYLRLPVEETFFRMMRHREFDVAEMSLSSYVVSLQRGPAPPFVALPVFTSRMFRHGGIFCHAGAGIERPEDLRGKVVGTPEYQLTAGVWIRGILADHHGVPVDSVRYFTGGQETPGPDREGRRRPRAAGRRSRRSRPGATLSAHAGRGRDRRPVQPRASRRPFAAGDPRVRRVFADVVGRREGLLRGHRHLPDHARRRRPPRRLRAPPVGGAVADQGAAAGQARGRPPELYDTSALRFMLPWLNQDLEEARALLGEDYWSYGLEANRTCWRRSCATTTSRGCRGAC